MELYTANAACTVKNTFLHVEAFHEDDASDDGFGRNPNDFLRIQSEPANPSKSTRFAVAMHDDAPDPLDLDFDCSSADLNSQPTWIQNQRQVSEGSQDLPVQDGSFAGKRQASEESTVAPSKHSFASSRQTSEEPKDIVDDVSDKPRAPLADALSCSEVPGLAPSPASTYAPGLSELPPAVAEVPDYPRGSATDPMSWDGTLTVMVRQVPRSYTQQLLIDELNSRGFEDMFDFIYLPNDHKRGVNVGYGFINFISAKHAVAFRDAFDGRSLRHYSSSRGCPMRVHPASVQGYDANFKVFAKTKTLQKQDPRFSPLFLRGRPTASPADQDLQFGQQKHHSQQRLQDPLQQQRRRYGGQEQQPRRKQPLQPRQQDAQQFSIGANSHLSQFSRQQQHEEGHHGFHRQDQYQWQPRQRQQLEERHRTQLLQTYEQQEFGQHDLHEQQLQQQLQWQCRQLQRQLIGQQQPDAAWLQHQIDLVSAALPTLSMPTAQSTCLHCGTLAMPTHSFCSTCGTRLGTSPLSQLQVQACAAQILDATNRVSEHFDNKRVMGRERANR